MGLNWILQTANSCLAFFRYCQKVQTKKKPNDTWVSTLDKRVVHKQRRLKIGNFLPSPFLVSEVGCIYYALFWGTPFLPPWYNVVYGRPLKLLSIHLMIGQLNFRFTTSLLTTGSHLRCQQYKNRPWCLFWMWCQIQSQTPATWMVAQCK